MGKSYTGTGDDGTTAAFGGDRISKNSARLRVIGAIDEVNSIIGHAASHLANQKTAKFGALNAGDRARAMAWLEALQHVLFRAGADLATPQDKDSGVPRINPQDTQVLEERTDAFDKILPELTNFILPSGTPSGSTLHFARAVVRRAERELVAARDAGEDLNEALVPFLNRLSSYLFALARWVNWRAAAPETAPRYDQQL